MQTMCPRAQTEDQREECSDCEQRWGEAWLLNNHQGIDSSPLEMALGHLKSIRARISEA